MVKLFAAAVTLLSYGGARMASARWAWIHPLVLAVAAVDVLWQLAGGDWLQYADGTEWISWWLGPATVALAVPLAREWRELAAMWKGIVAGVGAGCAASIAFTWEIVRLLGGDDATLRSLLSRSVTTPISVELTAAIGGNPALAGLFTAVTGLVGIIVARPLLRLAGIRSDWAIGIAVGTSCHAIGTASLLRDSEQQASASGLAMIVAGIVTSLYLMPFFR